MKNSRLFENVIIIGLEASIEIGIQAILDKIRS